MTRLRIVYLHQYFTSPKSAGGTRSYELARRLVTRGHEVHVVTSDRTPARSVNRSWRTSNESGIQVHWLPVPYSNYMSYAQRLRAFLHFAARSAAKAAAISADVIFATSTPLTIALPGVYAARRQSVPMVFEVRDLWPEIPIAIGALNGRLSIGLARWLERFAYRNSAQIIALSPGMQAGVIAAGYPAQRVHIIPNGADLDLFDVPQEVGKEFRARFDWLANRPLVVYTGSLGVINGVTYLVQLAAVVKKLDPEVRFLVVGDGKDKPQVLAKASEVGVLDTSFYMLDSLPKLEMPAVLAAASLATSLFIDLPEMWANSANKFFDALASGTPIAVNYRGWQADLIQETGVGLVLDAKDIGQSAQRLVRAVRDRNWLEQAGYLARQLATDRFSREVLARQFESVLVDAVADWHLTHHTGDRGRGRAI